MTGRPLWSGLAGLSGSQVLVRASQRAWDPPAGVAMVHAASASRAARRGAVAVHADFPGGRVDHGSDVVDGVGGEAAAVGVLEDRLGAVGDVDAEQLVVGDVAVHPLGARRQRGEHFVGFRRDGGELFARQRAGPGGLGRGVEVRLIGPPTIVDHAGRFEPPAV